MAKAKTKKLTKQEQIIEALIAAYWKEMETVQNYIALSTNLDGMRADPIKKSLGEDVGEELGHAQALAARIRVLGGVVPGSYSFRATQKFLQPPKSSTDMLAVIKGVIEAEEDAINSYNEIIKMCDGIDYPTQDLAITLLADEEEHRREFIGFLRGYEAKK